MALLWAKFPKMGCILVLALHISQQEEKPFGGEAALSQERLTWVHHPAQLGRERRGWRGREGGGCPANAQQLLKQARYTHYPWLISTCNLAVPGTAQSPRGWVSQLSLRE